MTGKSSNVTASGFSFHSTADSLNLLGPNDDKLLEINSNGIVTALKQPYVHACIANTISNKTGKGQTIPVIYDEVIKNTGEYYNSTTGEFIAGVAGLYKFSAELLFGDITDMMDNADFFFVTPEKEYRIGFVNPATARTGENLFHQKAKIMVQLFAGAVVQMKTSMGNTPADSFASILGNNSTLPGLSCFEAKLVGSLV